MTISKTILVIGVTGQLGQSIKSISDRLPDYRFVFTDRHQLDLSIEDNIKNFFQQNTFDIIINCAAYTAVDKAESQPELADQINHLAVKQLADAAQEQHAKFIHISTDYVFNGNQYRPYVESDEVSPLGVYGLTKLNGERAIQSSMSNNALIVRTSWVYSEYGNNFVKTMLKLGKEHDRLNVVFDQIGTPTYAKDLADAIMQIIQSPAFTQTQFDTGTLHFSNEGVTSWYDFAKTIFELTNTQCNLNPIETKDYPTVAKRPRYSVLNKTNIKQSYNLIIPYWGDSLQRCLASLQEYDK